MHEKEAKDLIEATLSNSSFIFRNVAAEHGPQEAQAWAIASVATGQAAVAQALLAVAEAIRDASSPE